jgi:hypothetical protein
MRCDSLMSMIPAHASSRMVWANNDDGQVCVSNPRSMTVSCGHTDAGGFLSYTSAAASLPGESVFDLDMWQGLVGLQGVDGGKPGEPLTQVAFFLPPLSVRPAPVRRQDRRTWR